MLVGIDSCAQKRFEHLMQNEKFLKRVFTDYEISYSNDTTNKIMRLAGIYCAKEALLKALQLGIGKEIELKQIGIIHKKSGAPIYDLDERAKQTLKDRGVENASLSITHTAEVSTAICICETK